MGVVVTELVFDGRAPELSDIVDKVREISGLSLAVTESGADVKADLFDLHAYLAFACAPDTQLKVYAYRTGAVKTLSDQTFGDVDLPLARCVQGLHEPAGTQAVYLRGYIGQEPTLFFVTSLALEALGGRPRHPIGDEERRQYSTRITPAELEERHRKLTKQMRPMLVISLFLLPVLIPLWLVGFLVMMPWRIWKAYQLYRDYVDGSGAFGRTRRAAGQGGDHGSPE